MTSPGFPGSWGTLGTSLTYQKGGIHFKFWSLFVQACTLLARHWEKKGRIGGCFWPPSTPFCPLSQLDLGQLHLGCGTHNWHVSKTVSRCRCLRIKRDL